MICGYLPFEDPNTSQLYKKILAGDYHCPKFISNSAKEFLKGILNTDPATRWNIEQIRKHAWFTQIAQDVSLGILVGYDNISVDQSILKQLEKFGYDLEHTRKCLEANKHNHVTSAYYLLLKKHLDQGGISVADYSYMSEHELALMSIKPNLKLNKTLAVAAPHPPQDKGQVLTPFPRHRKYIEASVSRRAESIGNNKDYDFINQLFATQNLHKKNASQHVAKSSSKGKERYSASPNTKNSKSKQMTYRFPNKKIATPRPPSVSKNFEDKRRGRSSINDSFGKGLDLNITYRFSPRASSAIDGKKRYRSKRESSLGIK
mmetsp:Transcript_11026/g.11074  ORF Transcript_11026/g.11074 Transcript_11026/m.11074 type:complete len:318 (-) Transcript_11026:159-1112(-)